MRIKRVRESISHLETTLEKIQEMDAEGISISDMEKYLDSMLENMIEAWRGWDKPAKAMTSRAVEREF